MKDSIVEMKLNKLAEDFWYSYRFLAECKLSSIWKWSEYEKGSAEIP